MVTSLGANGQEPPHEGPHVGPREPLRLTLSEDFSRGRLDGAWWPRSRDLETELRDLLGDLPESLGPLGRVVCSGPDWDRAPQKVTVGGALVEIARFPREDAHLVILILSSRNLTLLVVPPDTAADKAAEAMLAASSPGNQASAHGLLLAPVGTDRGLPSEQWSDHGESWWAPHPVPPSERAKTALVLPPRRQKSVPEPRTAISFEQAGGIYTGCSEDGRLWRITEVRTGWRLEFQDTGDLVKTYAGVHRTVNAAIAEANR